MNNNRLLQGMANFTLVITSIVSISCQPIPQPFAHPAQTINLAAVPKSNFGGITILPIRELPSNVATILSETMVAEFLKHNIIASNNISNYKSKFLQGTPDRIQTTPKETSISILWNLIDVGGALMGSRRTKYVSVPKFSKIKQSDLRQEMADVTGYFADLIKKQNGQLIDHAIISLHVWPLSGGINDRDPQLQNAMKTELKNRNFKVLDTLDGAQIVIAGNVELGREKLKALPLSVTWSVFNSAGKELGKITQRNTVSSEKLGKSWGPLATLIAKNAAGGLSKLVRQIPREQLRPINILAN